MIIIIYVLHKQQDTRETNNNISFPNRNEEIKRKWSELCLVIVKTLILAYLALNCGVYL